LKPWQRGLEIGMAHGYFLRLGSRFFGGKVYGNYGGWASEILLIDGLSDYL